MTGARWRWGVNVKELELLELLELGAMLAFVHVMLKLGVRRLPPRSAYDALMLRLLH